MGPAEYIDETEKIGSKMDKSYRVVPLQYSKGFDLVGSAQMGKEWIAVRSQDLGLWLFSLEDGQELYYYQIFVFRWRILLV